MSIAFFSAAFTQGINFLFWLQKRYEFVIIREDGVGVVALGGITFVIAPLGMILFTFGMILFIRDLIRAGTAQSAICAANNSVKPP